MRTRYLALLALPVVAAACGGGQEPAEGTPSTSSAFLGGDEDDLYMAGMRAWRDDSPALAETKFREALVANPRYLAAHIALGQLLLDEGRAQESVDAFDGAIELRSSSVDAHLGRSQALLGLGRYEDAFAAGSTAIVLAADNDIRELEAAAHTATAQALTAMNDIEGAVAAYEAALVLDAGTTTARVGLARLYVELGDLPNAVRVLGRAASYEQDAEDLLAVGQAFHEFGVYDPALDVLEAAYARDPSIDDVLYYYASSAVRSGRHELGNSIATELIARNPEYLVAYLARGEASLQRGYIHNAREDAALVLSRDPNNYDALVLDGDVEAADEEIDGAIARYNRAIEIDPTRLRAIEHLGLVHYGARNWYAFVELIEPAIDLAGRPESWLGMLVDAMSAAGLEERLVPYESRLAYERGSDDQLHHRVAERALRFPDSLEPFTIHDHARLAIEHIGGAPLEYRLTLFDALMLIGRVDEARNTLNIAEQYYPNSSEVSERRDRL